MLKQFAEFSEKILGNSPMFVIGSGLSMAAGISGMPALARWLGEQVHPGQLDYEAWQGVLACMEKGIGLEQSLLLAGSSVSQNLREEIVRQTWSLISSDEIMPLLQIANGKDLTGFRHLLDRFAYTTNNNLHVVTTNYDHILEWSAAMAGWPVWDGFDQGPVAKPINNEDWGARMSRIVSNGRRSSSEPVKHLKLYKLHGSLSWFRLRSGGLMKIPSACEPILGHLAAEGFLPAIITPGTDKYLETHSQPYLTMFSEMNTAIQLTTSIVFVGFGFNDLHIQGGLDQKLRDRNVHKLILSMKLSEPLRALLAGGGVQNYVAVEKADEGGSTILSNHLGEGNVTADIWNLKGFLASAWGGEYE